MQIRLVCDIVMKANLRDMAGATARLTKGVAVQSLHPNLTIQEMGLPDAWINCLPLAGIEPGIISTFALNAFGGV